MTRKGLGMTAIVNQHNIMLGIYTDGDLRRTLDAEINLQQTPITEVMQRNCKTIGAESLAAEALQRMDQHKINALLVTDSEQRLLGALNMHDLLRAGVV